VDPAALDSVTTVNPRGFTPAVDGSIAGDRAVLGLFGDVPVAPTIGVFLPDETQALDQILASQELSAAHIAGIVAFVEGTNAAGIDLDYKTVAAERADAFTAFVGALSERLHAEGKTLTISLPVPVRSGETWDSQGYQWEAIVPLVDGVKLAPPDPAQYFVVMEDALEYLVPRVGGAKLLLTVGPLSREQSVDGVRTITLNNALARASVPATSAQGPVGPGAAVEVFGQNLVQDTGGSGLHWDDEARAVMFTYAGAGGQRTVWIANGFSEAFKLELADRYALGGVAVDSIGLGSASANIWPQVREFAAGGELSLVAPNDALLEPRWAASAGDLETDSGAEVVWNVPEQAGTFTVTLVVSDGSVRAGQQLTVTVGATALAR
jgi:hypothetical protein